MTTNASVCTWLGGRGLMTQKVLAYDWSRTPLGAMSSWPESLRIPVQLILRARQPMYLA